MRKASRIISIVAAVLAFIACIEYLLTGVILLVCYNQFRELLQTLAEEMPSRLLQELLLYFYRMYRTTMITSFIYAFLCVFYGIILLTTLNSNSKGMYIFKIVFGVFMSRIGLVGAILGLVAHEREAARKAKEVEAIEK